MNGPAEPRDPNRYADHDLPDDELDEDEIAAEEAAQAEEDNYLADYAADADDYPVGDHPNY